MQPMERRERVTLHRIVLSPLLLLVALLTGLGLNLSPASATGGPETRVSVSEQSSPVTTGDCQIDRIEISLD
jgi:hypothetical protein